MPDPSSPPPPEPSPLERPPPDRPWSERLRDLRLRLGLDARAAAWGLAAVAGLAVAAWLLRPAPTPLEESLPVATSEAGPAPGAGPPASGPEGEGAPAAGGSASSSSVPTVLVAHAAGAVAHPGVYELPAGARVDDLVRAAGGLAPDADPARLNLAAALTDGVRVYVPRRGEGEPPVVAPPDGGVGAVGGGEAAPGPAGEGGEAGAPIDVNAASEAELEELPGVGPSIAAAIVAHREENGPFRTVDDLLDVRGIGEAKLAEIRPRATV